MFVSLKPQCFSFRGTLPNTAPAAIWLHLFSDRRRATLIPPTNRYMRLCMRMQNRANHGHTFQCSMCETDDLQVYKQTPIRYTEIITNR